MYYNIKEDATPSVLYNITYNIQHTIFSLSKINVMLLKSLKLKISIKAYKMS